MAETIVLDPTEVATARTQFDLTPFIDAAGPDWGDAAITQYLAEANRGQIPVDYRVPNRTITIPLNVMARGTVTFDQARSQIQAKAGLMQREGGWLKRVTSGGTAVFADITNATLKYGGGWSQAYKSYDVDASLVLEAIPDFYGAEIDLGDNVETTLPELIFTDTGVQGDFPGRVRIVVDEDDADTQLGLLWGFRSKHYSSASTAALAYEAEALTALDTATKPAVSGASGGTVVRHAGISTSWTPVVGTNLTAGTYLTHTGSYRAWARCYTTATNEVQVRFVYNVGDLTSPVENDFVRMPAVTNWYMLDLGEVRLDPAPVGTHRWQGQVQARGQFGGEQFNVDRIMFQPLDDGAGKLRAPPRILEGAAPFTARDEFNQLVNANLVGQSASVGGAWTGAGSGSADFITDNIGHELVRGSSTPDGAVNTASGGRYVLSGAANMANVVVQVDETWTTDYQGYQGVIARYVDTSNWIWFLFSLNWQVVVYMMVAGSFSVAGGGYTFPTVSASRQWRTIRAAVFDNGIWMVWAGEQGTKLGDPLHVGSHTALATGGALQTGKVGIRDVVVDPGTRNNFYDNFAAWVPLGDTVAYPSQSVQLATDGVYREDSAGVAWGQVRNRQGGLPRIPPSGLEGRTVQTVVKMSRGDFDNIPDAGIDNISARLFYRPSWLFVP